MSQDSWYLSKSIPLTFVLAIIGQTIALVWFVADLNNDIEINTRELVRHETRLMALENVVQTQAVTMARIDENIKAIRTTLTGMAERGN